MRQQPISTLFPYTTLFRSRSKLTGSLHALASLRSVASAALRPAMRGSFFSAAARTSGPPYSSGNRRIALLIFASSARDRRSEEHTSELQSHSDLVCRLLLE